MTTATPAVPVPKNAEELAEILGDPGRLAPVLANKDALGEFINSYAKAQQAPGTDMHAQVETEVQRQMAAMLRENEVPGDKAEGIQRLNLSPQNGAAQRASMLMSHRQATAHNPKAPGAALDKEFRNAGEFIHAAWHLNNDADAQSKMARLRNEYSSVTPSDGGFLVPETLRSQLLEIALEMSLVRPNATVIPMESARVPIPMIDSTTNQGSVFGGMLAYWGEESAELEQSSPKFGRVVLDAKKLTGLAVTPNELLQDSLISFEALLQRLWPQALAFHEDAAFISGGGAGEPLGFLGAGNAASVAVAKESSQAADTIVFKNIVKMYSRMLPSSLANAVWVCSPEALPELFTMALDVGTGGSAVMLTNATGPAPMTIFGRPLIVSEKANRLGDRGDIAFVDLSYYLVGDRQTMTAASSTDYKFGSDQTTFRIIQRVDGRPWLKSPITPANGGPTLSPFVELADRA